MRRLLTVVTTSVLTLALSSGVASAQDAWPVDPGQGAPVRPVDVTSFVLLPDQPNFYNPFLGLPRVVSPFGRSTKIVCTGFRSYDDCWQADQFGNPHQLHTLFGLGSVSSPASKVFVYPGMIPGL